MAKMDEATRKRVRAGRLMLAGKTPAQAASAVGVARQTAYTWKARLDEGGGNQSAANRRIGSPLRFASLLSSLGVTPWYRQRLLIERS